MAAPLSYEYNITLGDNSQVYILQAPVQNACDPKVNITVPKDTLLSEIEEIIDAVYQGKKEMNMNLSTQYNRIGLRNGSYFTKKAERLENCSSYLAFSRVDGKMKMVKTNLCRVRLCPMCAYKRSLSIYRNTREIYDLLIKKEPHSKFLFITLTIQNVSGDSLKSAIDSLNRGFQNIIRQKAFKRISLGTMRTIEITYNSKTNTYHPHIHILLHTTTELYAGRNYITQQKITDMWAAAAGLSYTPIVDIRRFKSNTKRELAEVAKYAVKPTDYVGKPDHVIITLDDVLHKRHLYSLAGSFKEAQRELKIKDMEERDDYLDKIRDLEAELILYRWHFGQNKYMKAETTKDIVKLNKIADLLEFTNRNKRQ